MAKMASVSRQLQRAGANLQVFVGIAAGRRLKGNGPSSCALAMLLIAAMVLLCYAPLGKIRHCLFFFLSRYHLGRHFGRRGTFPLRH